MILCDTNVLSELARRQPDPGVRRWAATVTSGIHVSVVTVEEIYFGLSWRPNERVGGWLERFLEERCAVLPISEAIARKAGELRGSLQARGSVRTQADMLIAATAQVHQLALVTRNVRDFEECGLALLNPFAA